VGQHDLQGLAVNVPEDVPQDLFPLRDADLSKALVQIGLPDGLYLRKD